MQYAIPSEVIEAGKELAKHGLEKEAKNIAESLLKQVEKPVTIEALLDEVNHAGETLELITPRMQSFDGSEPSSMMSLLLTLRT